MRERKKGLIIIFVVLAISFLICVGVIIFNYMSIEKENKIYAELEQYKYEEIEVEEIKLESQEEVEDEIKEETIEETIEAEPEEYISPIDFDKLQTEVNKDIYAWIKVEGTIIDYPVLQHDSDDSYYLTHNLDGSTGYPGCIYSEHYNNKDFQDKITVLYGHNMRAGTMFAGLHKFKDKDFFEKNQFIEIFLPTEKKVYKIVGAFYTNDRRITTYYRTMTTEGANSWIDTIGEVKETERDHVRAGEYSKDDTFLVLETCIGQDKEHRLVVVGILEKE